MPHTEVFFFRDAKDGSVPLLDWLDGFPAKAQAKCVARIDRLSELGHEIRRPEADFLRDGIYELRASYQGVHYRILYFFAGRAAVVLSHGFAKEREVPPREIDTAVEWRRRRRRISQGLRLGWSRFMPKKKLHSTTSRFLYDRYIAGDPKREREYEEVVVNAEIARKIFELRSKAGLTQQELAVKVGTSKSAICRLEDGDYAGHSLSMLKRIAEALDKRIEIRFLPVKRTA